jgi:hypothetical protein
VDEEPTIDSIIPAVSPLHGGIQMQVMGENFNEGTILKIDGYVISNTKLQSPSSRHNQNYTLSFTSPPLEKEGFKRVQVINPNGKNCTLDNVLYYSDFQNNTSTSSGSNSNKSKQLEQRPAPLPASVTPGPTDYSSPRLSHFDDSAKVNRTASARVWGKRNP